MADRPLPPSAAAAVQIRPADVRAAAALWRRYAPPALRSLLEATQEVPPDAPPVAVSLER